MGKGPKYLDVIYLPPCESKESLEKKPPEYQADNFYEGEIKNGQLVGLPVHVEHMFEDSTEKIPITNSIFREKLGDYFADNYPYKDVQLKKHIKVGKVVSNWYRPGKGAYARIKLDDNSRGDIVWERIGMGRFQEVSLGHKSNINFTGSASGGLQVKREPIEISIVVKGRRNGTKILQPIPGFMKQKVNSDKRDYDRVHSKEERFKPYSKRRKTMAIKK